MDLACAQVEVHAVVGDERAEAFGDAAKLEGASVASLRRQVAASYVPLRPCPGCRDLAVDDLLLDRLTWSAYFWPAGADLADPDAVGLQVEDTVGAALVRVVLDGLDRVVDSDVDLLSALVMICGPR